MPAKSIDLIVVEEKQPDVIYIESILTQFVQSVLRGSYHAGCSFESCHTKFDGLNFIQCNHGFKLNRRHQLQEYKHTELLIHKM